MSEKFGLDWKLYPKERVEALITVHKAIQKKQEIEFKKK
jgi:hypothetical protein